MTTRTVALVVASLVVPVLWGWLAPLLLARLWPPRPPSAPPGASFPDYEI